MSRDETVRAYDLDAEAYAANGPAMPDSVRADIEGLAALLGRGARVLEIGSGGGRDARLMEELGLLVRRTDITPASSGCCAGRATPATSSTRSSTTCPRPAGPYDAVWANASLLHVRRDDLPTVLERLAAVDPHRGGAAGLAQGG